MKHNITKTQIEFKGNNITKITVHVHSNEGKIDKFYTDTKLRAGYLQLSHDLECVNLDLLQRIASFGIKI